MRPILFTATLVAIALSSTSARAQHDHADIELGYDNLSSPTSIEVEQDNVTTEGLQYFEAEFEEVLSDFFTTDPGFITNAGEGLLVGDSDQIWFNVLDASANSSFGVGFVNFYNPTTDSLQALGSIQITDNGGSGTDDLILDGASIMSGDNPQLIDTANGAGDIHNHLTFDLLNDGTAPLGAYGLLVQLQADFDTPDGTMDVSSAPFWLIFNHGMDDGDFDSLALPKFGVAAIPEPGSTALITLGLGAILIRQRRNR